MSKKIALRPSAAAIWAGAGCTAYPQRAADYSDKDMDNTAAAEGTAAHWLAENLLLSATPGAAEYLGAPAPNGVMVTDDMVDAVATYTDHIKGLRGDPRIEQSVDVFKGCRGTPDFWAYDPQGGILHVIDYKHGFSLVDPFNNWQLSLYAAGIIKHWPTDSSPAPKKVRLTVVQPRAYSPDGPVRSWDADASVVESMRITAATRAVEATANPVARSGSHCRYCPARHVCPAAVDSGVQLYEAATSAAPYDLADNEMGVQYAIIQRAHEQLGYLVAAYEQQIKSALYKGSKVDGFALVEKRGRAEWDVDAAEVQALGELFGVELCPPTPLTPSKALKKGIDTHVISAYTTRHSKGHTLAPVNLTNAKRIFS